MKRAAVFVIMAFMALLMVPAAAISSDGTNTCGYEMMVVPVQTVASLGTATTPAILDAWTTNDPYMNPFAEVYDFARGVDTLAFVVYYRHTGGVIPDQYAKGWACRDEAVPLKTCRFNWTIGYLPPGDFLLINYFDPVQFPVGSYDWASKVGDVVFGWPDISSTRPSCFNVN